MIYGKPTLFLLGRQDHVTGYEVALKLMEQYPRAEFAIALGLRERED
jgi:pimeloyl-ACP methyl ester carboxylesterase